jgi:hypothetical protein
MRFSKTKLEIRQNGNGKGIFKQENALLVTYGIKGRRKIL